MSTRFSEYLFLIKAHNNTFFIEHFQWLLLEKVLMRDDANIGEKN